MGADHQGVGRLARLTPTGGMPRDVGAVMIRVRNQQDVAAGLFLVLIAVLAYVLAADLPMGRAVRMGPGYLPTLLSWLLGALGLAIMVRGLVVSGPRLAQLAWRPLLALTGSLLVFAALLERGGLIAAVVASVVVSSLAAPGARAIPVVILGVVLAAGSAALFFWLLNLPLILWPRFG